MAFKIFVCGHCSKPQINFSMHIKQIMRNNIMNNIPDVFPSVNTISFMTIVQKICIRHK